MGINRILFEACGISFCCKHHTEKNTMEGVDAGVADGGWESEWAAWVGRIPLIELEKSEISISCCLKDIDPICKILKIR